MTPSQLKILQHALGLDEFGQPPKGSRHSEGRNHFCAGTGDEPTCRELVALGFMVQHETTTWLPYFNCSVTKAGKNAVREQSPAPPKMTAGQKRWQEYQAYSDANDCTFKEWLGFRKSDWYLEMKAGSWQ